MTTGGDIEFVDELGKIVGMTSDPIWAGKLPTRSTTPQVRCDKSDLGGQVVDYL